MLYNLKAREDSGFLLVFCLILIILPRLNARRVTYLASLVFVSLSVILLVLPVYRINGLSNEFNYSKWLLGSGDLIKSEVIDVLKSRNVQAFYYPPVDDKASATCWYILLHGGGFTAGSAGNMNYLGSALSAMGQPSFSLDYSLAPKYVFPNQIQEIDSLISNVRSNERFSHFSSLPFIIIGESAGGTIALNYAAYEPDSALYKLVNLYGITDPGFVYSESKESHADLDAMTNSYRGGTSVDIISPLRNASLIKVPVITFHGTDDVIVPVSQSVEFYTKRQNLGFADDTLFLLKGATHLFDHPLSGPSGQFFLEKLKEIVKVANN
jgi:acetyl esterase/lipase